MAIVPPIPVKGGIDAYNWDDYEVTDAYCFEKPWVPEVLGAFGL